MKSSNLSVFQQEADSAEITCRVLLSQLVALDMLLVRIEFAVYMILMRDLLSLSHETQEDEDDLSSSSRCESSVYGEEITSYQDHPYFVTIVSHDVSRENVAICV